MEILIILVLAGALGLLARLLLNSVEGEERDWEALAKLDEDPLEAEAHQEDLESLIDEIVRERDESQSTPSAPQSADPYDPSETLPSELYTQGLARLEFFKRELQRLQAPARPSLAELHALLLRFESELLQPLRIHRVLLTQFFKFSGKPKEEARFMQQELLPFYQQLSEALLKLAKDHRPAASKRSEQILALIDEHSDALAGAQLDKRGVRLHLKAAAFQQGEMLYLQAPASPESIEALEGEVLKRHGLFLPQDYLEVLRRHDGLEILDHDAEPFWELGPNQILMPSAQVIDCLDRDGEGALYPDGHTENVRYFLTGMVPFFCVSEEEGDYLVFDFNRVSESGEAPVVAFCPYDLDPEADPNLPESYPLVAESFYAWMERWLTQGL